jgi:cell division protein FtsQ
MARKSGLTILQEELYPPSVGATREEMDDARLVDLDVDEESPFLRGQKRVSARRSSLPKKTANRLLWGVVAAAAVCMTALGAAALYHYGEHSWRFRVESSDNIEVMGMQNVTKAQIMEVMGADIGRNIFFIPLAQQKAQLEQIPWVESASVMRFVPNRLQVEIHERTPVAFARVGPRLSLIDAGGTLMELSPKHKYSFPVLIGMNPGEPLSTRAPRMKTYREMVRELDSGGARYSQDLSEVDLSDLEDVKVRVNDPAGDVLVHLGSSDYLRRYKIFVSHAQAWRQQFQKLESVDLRYDNQIIVNPDMEKPAPMKLTVAKAAAAAGVKPVSLLTRVGPNDRPVPKPAFELMPKKLDPKLAAASTRKVANQSKVNKSATVAGNTAAEKNVAPANKSLIRTHPKKWNAPGVARRTVERKKVPTRSSGAIARSSGHTGGKKPSPAIAKTQASQEPSD